MEVLTPFVGWIGLFLGVISRVFVPWLNARRANPETAQWSWRYVWPQAIAVVIVLLLLPLLLGTTIESVGDMTLVSAYLAGYAVADIGRLVDKRLTGL
jgi:hypothetical protein